MAAQSKLGLWTKRGNRPGAPDCDHFIGAQSVLTRDASANNPTSKHAGLCLLTVRCQKPANRGHQAGIPLGVSIGRDLHRLTHSR